MSFSKQVKEEILRIEVKRKCCKFSELEAIIRNGAIFNIKDDKISILLQTKSALIIRKVFELLKDLYGYLAKMSVRKNLRVMYMLEIDDFCVVKDLLKRSCIEYSSGMKYNKLDNIKKSKCCRRSYISGFFLMNGSINQPGKNYHLEIVNKSEIVAFENKEILDKFGLNLKMVERKGNYVLYLKDGQNIVDFLNIIRAHKALMEFENIRVVKDVKNNVNRIINCETANLEKIVNTAVRQIEDIRYIEKTIGIKNLPKNLQDIAYARLENEDLPLKELGLMLNPILGKSGVNHRLKKIEKIANDLRKDSTV